MISWPRWVPIVLFQIQEDMSRGLTQLTRLHTKWDPIMFFPSLKSLTNIFAITPSTPQCPPVRVWIEFHNLGLKHLPQTNKGQLSPCLATAFCGRFFRSLLLFPLSSEVIIIVHYDCGPLLLNCDDVFQLVDSIAGRLFPLVGRAWPDFHATWTKNCICVVSREAADAH